ncbi:MAG: hypothetical protein K6A30_03040 [Lachnospiraceae bacterium]|nr:hypothetical protein [Lachnospiraceae bacterium]
MKNEKLCKIARIVDRLLAIAFVINWIGLFFLIVGGTVAVVTMTRFGTTHVNLDFFGMAMVVLKDPKFLNQDIYRMMSVVDLVVAFAKIVVIIISIHLVRKVLEPMKEGRPFEKGMDKQITVIGWMSLGVGFFGNVMEIFNEIQMSRMIHTDDIFNMKNVLNVTWKYSFDWKFILVAIGILLMSFVFHYGEELQKESDEML